MKSTLLLLLTLAMLSMCTIARGEGNCPPGYAPSGAGPDGVQGWAPLPGNNSNNTQEAGVWEDRYGAIATDDVDGLVGAVTDATSKSQAKDAALLNCKNKGGTHCEHRVWFRNGCGSMAVGEKHHSINTAETLDGAKDLSLKKCEETGDASCKVLYADCSFPKRIR